MYNQIIINSILNYSVIVIISLSFSLIYRTTKFFHFAHAIIFTSGAYFTFLFSQSLGFNLYFSMLLAVLAGSIVGCMMEWIIYRPLRRKNSKSLILLLASLGIYISLQNLISIIFGDNTKSIRTWLVEEGMDIFGARITPVQIITVFASIIIVLLVSEFLLLAKTGKAMRTVASDLEMAKVSGINSDKIILISFAIGSALASVAGILVALDMDMNPTMGMNALLMGVVAMIIGGVGNIKGIVLGSLLLAVAQNLGSWYISSQWMDAIVFGILLIFLLFKPEGFMGKKLRKAEV